MKRLTSWVSDLVPGDGDERHGINGYSNLGCRCEVCRAANVAEHRKYRAARSRALAADPSLRPHGVLSTYFNYGCRCPDCRAARATAERKAKAARA